MNITTPPHCWHSDRQAYHVYYGKVGGMKAKWEAKPPKGTVTGYVEKCCHCGSERIIFIVREPDERHGPHVSVPKDTPVVQGGDGPCCVRSQG